MQCVCVQALMRVDEASGCVGKQRELESVVAAFQYGWLTRDFTNPADEFFCDRSWEDQDGQVRALGRGKNVDL